MGPSIATRIARLSQTSLTVVHFVHGNGTTNTDCAIDYHCGGTLSPNPDIGGLGVS